MAEHNLKYITVIMTNRKTSMKKRLLSLFLASLMLGGTLLSCSESKTGQEGEPSETTLQTVSAEPITEDKLSEPEKDSLEAREDVPDEVPDQDFGGRIFNIAGYNRFDRYYLTDELNGDVVNDAVFNRNAEIQDRFNVTMNTEFFDNGAVTQQVKNSVSAGDDAYQMFSEHIIQMGMGVTNNIMYDMAVLPRINFSKPWWSDSTVNDLTYKGMTFIAIGEFNLSAVERTYCMFYNKELAVDFNLPDMYELVNEGDWTLDKELELSEGVYMDKNGNGERDKGDLFALSTTTKSAANAYLWAFGKKIADQQPDGTYEISYFDEKLVSLMERLYGMYYETDQVYFEVSHNTMTAFVPRNALFADGYFGQATSDLRDVEFDYGIIPYPKWDAAQPEYYSSVDGGHEGLAVPRGITDPEYVGTIVEVLNAESWKKTVPAYYDVALKYKGARDYESIAMIDSIMDSRIFDFGYVYGGWGPAFWIQYLLEAQSKDITSFYQKGHKQFETYMGNVYNAFEKYDAGN